MIAALDPIRDIRGIDPVPWWPLAPGWWMVAVVLLAMFAAGLLVAVWVLFLRRDWRNDARRELRQLGARVHQVGAKEVAAELSELLRRIAMVRYGRATCASLTGEAWLRWLTAQDPAGFPWLERGRVLIELPYAPLRDQARVAGTDPEQLRALVEAVFPWTESSVSQVSYAQVWKARAEKFGHFAREWIARRRMRYFHV